MVKVRMIESGQIMEVTSNVAFGLVDSGKASLQLKVPQEQKQVKSYPNRAMTSKRTRKYHIK